jgi:hypothetical protein
MELLKATEARQINKADLTEAETLVFEGRIIFQKGKQHLEPGEFYFRSTYIPRIVNPSWWKRIFLRAKPKETLDVVDTIVITCPFCSMPILTAPMHKVLRHNPLTLATKITCPNVSAEGAHSFSIKDGKIMPA